MEDKTITVYEVKVGGSGYLERNLGNVMDMIKDLDVDCGYVINKVEILESKYKKLPEFMGF